MREGPGEGTLVSVSPSLGRWKGVCGVVLSGPLNRVFAEGFDGCLIAPTNQSVRTWAAH